MTVKYTRWLRSYIGHQRILQIRASGFIRDQAGRVLLCRRADVMLWDVPGGAIELDETPAQGLIREIEGETGLIVAPERLIGVYSGPDFQWTYPNGDQVQIISVFLACRIVRGELRLEGYENVTVDFFPQNQLPALLHRTSLMLDDAFANREAAFFD
ncbi:MAG: NUDIX domain-containing protein [Chloroflexales bacterium]|nr:NUDIX domain-containing protein [Chloroflexales bacterium]